MKKTDFFCFGMALLALCGCGRKTKHPAAMENPASPVIYYRIPKETTAHYRIFPGVIQPETQVNLSFRLTGRLVLFPSGPGQRVRKGELLAKLDPVLFQAAADAAKARYDEALRDYERSKVLYEKNVMAAADFEKKKRDLDVAEAGYRNARDDLADSVIYAPFSGIVSNTYVDNYQQVKANEVLIRLQDLNSFEVTIDVPEKEVARFPLSIVQANRNAVQAGGFYGTLPSLPAEHFPLELKEASTQADTAAQTFTVTFRIRPRNIARLLPGMSMAVHVPMQEGAGHPGFNIPSGAMFTRDGKSFVWKIDPAGRVHRTQVTPVLLQGSFIRVQSTGLKNGDMIAQTGIQILDEGEKVCPLTETSKRKLTGERL
jgi:RND family efflux transporter MFP subunit